MACGGKKSGSSKKGKGCTQKHVSTNYDSYW